MVSSSTSNGLLLRAHQVTGRKCSSLRPNSTIRNNLMDTQRLGNYGKCNFRCNKMPKLLAFDVLACLLAMDMCARCQKYSVLAIITMNNIIIDHHPQSSSSIIILINHHHHNHHRQSSSSITHRHHHPSSSIIHQHHHPSSIVINHHYQSSLSSIIVINYHHHQ